MKGIQMEIILKKGYEWKVYEWKSIRMKSIQMETIRKESIRIKKYTNEKHTHGNYTKEKDTNEKYANKKKNEWKVCKCKLCEWKVYKWKVYDYKGNSFRLKCARHKGFAESFNNYWLSRHCKLIHALKKRLSKYCENIVYLAISFPCWQLIPKILFYNFIVLEFYHVLNYSKVSLSIEIF